jgi:DNA polymerase-3 subunit gamma/tau
LMQELNLLVNAGHSPSSLARQMVRYLRNSLMAKLGGEQTELLQISGDERARAARTALLFTEEELTRNLQIVLRTFDDLNYRQEQRFHLELGLLKLIHAQRLLPLEELLSGVASGAGTRTLAPTSAPRASASPSRPSPAVPQVAPSAPPISPFGPTGGNWGSGPKMDSALKPQSAAGPVATMERSSITPTATPVPTPKAADSPFAAATPFPATNSPTTGYAVPLTEGALAKAPQAAAPAPASVAPSIEALRHAIGSALVNAGHNSAAQLLGSSAWNFDGANLRIEAPGMGKKMLALTVNPAAEKIIRQELQRLGAPTRFLIVPGNAATAGPAITAVPMAGSIQEAALAHPLVQKAKEIFHAEVRSVVDLRLK